MAALAWPSRPGFSLRVPSGWELRERQGIDSYVGEVVGDGIRLTYDYGIHSWRLNPADDPEHIYAVIHQDIGGVAAKLLISMDAPGGFTGVNLPRLDAPSLTIYGEDLTPAQQHTAVAIFMSIRLAS